MNVDNRYPRLEPSSTWHATPEIYAYTALLSLFILSPGSVVFTPLQFLYKDQLHMDAAQVSSFKLIINLVGYFGFVFGMIRDRYNPLRLGDRGYFIIFGVVAAVILFALPSVPLKVASLGAGLMVWGASTSMIGAAYQALMRNIAQARMMTGRMSTTYQVMVNLIGAIALMAGGYLTDHVSWQNQLRAGAGFYLLIALFGFWKPDPFLSGVRLGSSKNWTQIGQEFMLLRRHRGFWVAIALWTIWSFSPAGLTPMMFFLTKDLHMSAQAFSNYNAWFAVALIPGTILFGPLCKKFRLWPLLVISTVIGIPQWMPAMFIHKPIQAYEAAIFMGLSGGLANAAFYGLLFRSCPEGLAGTGMMFAGSLALAVVEFGNVLGSHIYLRWGFAGCSYATTAVYALMLPLLFLLPKALVEPRDDERVPTEEELLAP